MAPFIDDTACYASPSYTTTTTTTTATAASPSDKVASSSCSLLAAAKRAIDKAAGYAWDLFLPEKHWYGELLSNAAVTAEQVFLHQALGQVPIPHGDAYRRYLLSEQNADGSWGIAPDYPGDVSTTSEAYLALKILGVPQDDPDMRHARKFVHSAGGVAKVRNLSLLSFAQFGLIPWATCPQLPAEFILMPTSFLITIYSIASWARSNIVPLMVICHHQPIYPLPNGRSATNAFLDELWLDPTNKVIPCGPSIWEMFSTDPVTYFFGLLDSVLVQLGGLRWSPTRALALRKCTEWILMRQEPEGDWSGTLPPMHHSIRALVLEGFTLDSKEVVKGMAAIDRFAWEDAQRGRRIQASVSPVWDTVLMVRALRDCGISDPRIDEAVAWTRARQILGPEGDWRVLRPGVRPGGFAFEYYNRWYPDIDDTSAVVLALLHANPALVDSETVSRAVEWILGMQNLDGGWAAFDWDSNKFFLHKLPFSDMDSLCDPSTADVVGRILEMFGLIRDLRAKRPRDRGLGMDPGVVGRIDAAVDRAINYLIRNQEPTGCWYGRWASNYIFGTCIVVGGLAAWRDEYPEVQTHIAAGTAWLKSVQNPDGGWGESLMTYKNPQLAGRGTKSTPSQTAWALKGLLATIDPTDEAVERGIRHLVDTQSDVSRAPVEAEGADAGAASWPERLYTGTGFPGHFYIGYTYYRHYFPMMALGRYVAAVTARDEGRNNGPVKDVAPRLI